MHNDKPKIVRFLDEKTEFDMKRAEDRRLAGLANFFDENAPVKGNEFNPAKGRQSAPDPQEFADLDALLDEPSDVPLTVVGNGIVHKQPTIDIDTLIAIHEANQQRFRAAESKSSQRGINISRLKADDPGIVERMYRERDKAWDEEIAVAEASTAPSLSSATPQERHAFLRNLITSRTGVREPKSFEEKFWDREIKRGKYRWKAATAGKIVREYRDLCEMTVEEIAEHKRQKRNARQQDYKARRKAEIAGRLSSPDFTIKDVDPGDS